MKTPVRIVLVGSAGRMGQAIAEAAGEDSTVDIVALCDEGDSIEKAIPNCDVIVDFSHANASAAICTLAAQHKKAMVVGTTGHSPEQRQEIENCGKAVPVVLSSNFSVGVNTLFWLTRKAAEMLGTDFDLEIIEMHHRMKKDAPSGTALSLAEILKSERDLEITRHGREGQVGERKRNEIGIHSVRGGDVVGDHTVVFAGAGERMELTHRAMSRQTFAKGALRAAGWIVGRTPGLYSMEDVLGLTRTP